MTATLTIEVNGKPRRVVQGQTVAGLLGSLDLDERAVVVELNRRIVRQGDLAHLPLREGDRLELVHFVGGG